MDSVPPRVGASHGPRRRATGGGAARRGCGAEAAAARAGCLWPLATQS